jgi:hypothetical protein
MNYYKLKQEHAFFKESALAGRYINFDHIDPLLKKHSNFSVKEIGRSVEDRKIHSIELGTGPVKILAWSQMHGNESTTTKALFDLLNFFGSDQEMVDNILKNITLLIIPMLNPDGAQRYTRFNANAVDLNRDAQALTQPESNILKKVYTEFKPHFALNLHGQRTIFGIGDPPRSATVSLLSPAQDKERQITPARERGMAVICSINNMLQEFLPGAVGRYDDSFNINCVGDTLQHLNIPTILFEAGHFAMDYEREQTRVFIFIALVRALEKMAELGENLNFNAQEYFAIPENKKCFYDYIVRNVAFPQQGSSDIAVHFEEKMDQNTLKFVPKIEKIGDLSAFKGHKEYDFKGKKPTQPLNFQWEEGTVLTHLSADGEQTISFSIN